MMVINHYTNFVEQFNKRLSVEKIPQEKTKYSLLSQAMFGKQFLRE